MSYHRWGHLIVILLVLSRLLASAATTDTGDPVFYTGPNEIDAGSLKVGGVPVSVAGASGSEYAAARLATTGNITLSGEQTVDGVLTAGSAVVVWLQTNAVQNGFYLSSTGILDAPDRSRCQLPSLPATKPSTCNRARATRARCFAWPIRAR